MINPSTENYALGKGILYFNKKDPATGLFEGERDLGNAPAVSVNISLEELAHYSSRGGLRAKDKKIISQISPVLNFTLDEESADNVALLFMGEKESVTQAADAEASATFTSKAARYFDLGYRGVGIQSLPYNTLTSAFNVGATVTGGTSAATGTIRAIVETDATTGALLLTNVSGTFQDAETLTDDGGTPGGATSAGADSFITTNLGITDGTTVYEQGTDYTVDSATGRVYITATSNIADATDLTAHFVVPAQTYTRIKGLATTEVVGMLRFVSDNPAGPQKELRIWSTSLTPTGDTAYIGDDWSTMSFVGEILKDETGHPDSPYVDVIMED